MCHWIRLLVTGIRCFTILSYHVSFEQATDDRDTSPAWLRGVEVPGVNLYKDVFRPDIVHLAICHVIPLLR